MECRIEARNLRHVRQALPECFDELNLGGKVIGVQRNDASKVGHQFGGDRLRFEMPGAAMDHAMPHHRDRAQIDASVEPLAQ